MKTEQHLDSVESTQTYVKNHIEEFDIDQLCFVSAKKQSQGKGTRGKSWYSPEGENIYVTYFFKLKHPPSHYINLAQIVSLSILRVLMSLGLKPFLKWPNDILLSKKKCGGILCEILEKPKCALVGVGLNVNMKKNHFVNIDIPSTSLHVESGKFFSTSDLLNLCTEQFKKDLALYEDQGFSPFYEDYKMYMPYIGYDVFVENIKIGKSYKVEKNGSLQIINEDYKISTVSSGSMKIY
jgi:BirA family transcriptional regulator, biotin operon repressor / biotin---[acetyl-CoA-carboxylase] ligase